MATDITLDQIDQIIADELEDLTDIRHQLHRNPQLAFQETFASGLVREQLDALNIPHQDGLAKTGVVGWITPDHADAAEEGVGLRADMDALPIAEATDLPYASDNDGYMHACGHDGHTAVLLGAARVLARLRDHLPRPIKLVFQPAEEWGGGGNEMVKAGALDTTVGDVKVSQMFGLHGWPQLEVGTVGIRPGPMLACVDVFYITITGNGGHGAMPHLTTDPIVAGSQIVSALQSVVSRNIDPNDAGVVTVGTFQAGQQFNIIPDDAKLTGTTRSLNETTRRMIRDRVGAIAEHTAAGLNCKMQIEWDIGYPVTVNDPAFTSAVRAVASQTIGEPNIVDLKAPTMGAEDFAYYGQVVPSCFVFLGLKPKDNDAYPPVHTPRFDFNDDALATGIRMMCQVAVNTDS